MHHRREHYGDSSVIFVPDGLGTENSRNRCRIRWLVMGTEPSDRSKKWRQSYGEPTLAEQMEIKKSHSVSNLPLLLMWLVFGIAMLALLGVVFVMLFHHLAL